MGFNVRAQACLEYPLVAPIWWVSGLFASSWFASCASRFGVRAPGKAVFTGLPVFSKPWHATCYRPCAPIIDGAGEQATTW